MARVGEKGVPDYVHWQMSLRSAIKSRHFGFVLTCVQGSRTIYGDASGPQTSCCLEVDWPVCKVQNKPSARIPFTKLVKDMHTQARRQGRPYLTNLDPLCLRISLYPLCALPPPLLFNTAPSKGALGKEELSAEKSAVVTQRCVRYKSTLHQNRMAAHCMQVCGKPSMC